MLWLAVCHSFDNTDINLFPVFNTLTEWLVYWRPSLYYRICAICIQ